MHISHVTLSTGHLARTSREDVADEVLAVVAPWLKMAVANGERHPLPVTPLSHYAALCTISEGALLCTIFAPVGAHAFGKPSNGVMEPLATMGVAQCSRHGETLWQSMIAQFGVKHGTELPSTPFCAVALHSGVARHLDALEWLGDLERCIAWAWITRNAQLVGL
jgi:hypothetical protein